MEISRAFRCAATLLALLTTLSGAPLAGQETLTNEGVVRMVEAELGADLILSAIRSQPAELDVSPQALIELKQQGVPENILTAMIDKMARSGEAAAPDPQEIPVPDGTEVRLRLRQTVSSVSAKINDPVLFETAEAVVIDGVTVVEEGAEGLGTVIMAQHKKGFGRRGKLDFTIDSVKATNGQNLRLQATQSLKGQDKYGTAGVVTILTGPFGVFVKGKDIEVPAGTEYTIYIDGDRTVKLGTTVSN